MNSDTYGKHERQKIKNCLPCLDRRLLRNKKRMRTDSFKISKDGHELRPQRLRGLSEI